MYNQAVPVAENILSVFRPAATPPNRYAIYGLLIESHSSFVNRLCHTDGSKRPLDLVFMQAPIAALTEELKVGSPLYTSQAQTKTGHPVFYLYHEPPYDMLRFTDVADFYLWPDRIIAYTLPGVTNDEVELCLLGTVLAFWREREGIPMFHAAAVAIENRAVGFLAHSTSGKSSLAAAVIRAGASLLTDDILPIERQADRLVAHAGYPQMRMWPDQAQYFLGAYEQLEQVHPAAAKRRVPIGWGGLEKFCSASQPLACLYLPERRGITGSSGLIEIQPVKPGEAVVELVRYTFISRIVAAMGWQQQRLQVLSRLVREVPIRRLIYPSGLEHLPCVAAAILADVQQLQL